ncbi:MAG: ABC transporter permease [Betaproteobacteria bacterium]|nr:ABC transporter permease [Betaproteobacteria bacterium]
MLARIYALVIKEFLALLKDRATRVVLVGPPIIQLIVFGYAATFDLNHVPYVVYDEDGGGAARQLLAHFEGSPTFRIVGRVSREEQIAPLLDNQSALVALHIGPHFSRDLLLHRPASVQVLIDGRNSNTAALALNHVSAILAAFNLQWMKEHGWRAPPAQPELRAWYNPNLVSRWFIVPGIVALLTLVVTLLVTGLSVAREREMGTLDQLLVTPLRPLEILIGKALPGFLIGGLEAAVITLAVILWFRVPFKGSVAALALGVMLFLLAVIGIGLLISTLAATQQQGLLGVFLFLVPAVILSGFSTPVSNMPEAVQWLTRVNPMRYFLVIVRGVFLEGADMTTLWPQYWPLALLGAASLSAATWRFRKRL